MTRRLTRDRRCLLLKDTYFIGPAERYYRLTILKNSPLISGLFVLVFQILHLRIFSKIGKNVVNKREGEKGCIGYCNRVNKLLL